MDYFCIDVESSGPIPGIHSLLSVGVTHVRKKEGIYQPFNQSYVEMRPIFPDFEEAAMAVNRLDLARLESEAMSPEAAMQQLVDFIEAERRGGKDKPVFVAHNAPFDWMFFAYYCGHTNVDNPFGHSALDTKALAMGKLKLPWNQTTLKTIASKLPTVTPMDPDQRHHAGHDAFYLARVFCAIMNLPEAP
jgi:DNA polymerase III epsilon subunit-like protein